MSTPARRHFMKTTAAQAAVGEGGIMQGSAFEKARYELHKDRAELKAERSVNEKERMKAQMLPKYEPYIQGVLEAGSGIFDEVFVTLMLWKLDAGDIEGAADMAEYAIKHGMDAPDDHKRTNAEILVEESVRKLTGDNGLVSADSRAVLERIAGIVQGLSMVDVVSAKLHKALGFACEDGGDLVAAAAHYSQAISTDQGCGCKTKLAKIEKRMKEQGIEPPGDGSQGTKEQAEDDEKGASEAPESSDS